MLLANSRALGPTADSRCRQLPEHGTGPSAVLSFVRDKPSPQPRSARAPLLLSGHVGRTKQPQPRRAQVR